MENFAEYSEKLRYCLMYSRKLLVDFNQGMA